MNALARVQCLSVSSACLLCLSAAAPTMAQFGPGAFTVQLQPVASGLTAPVQFKPCPDGSGRMFIVDQAGEILILKNGAVLPTPFLDLSSQIVTLNPGYDERGLLGMEFHPDYAHNGRFFVRYSHPRVANPGDQCDSPPFGCHEEILAEYHVSADNPDIADPAGTILIRVDKPQFNHNSGGILFGPDGYLYFTLGDGGGANDGLADTPPSHGPTGNAQNLGVILGKILRIDVSTPNTYTSPPSNPLVGVAGARPEVYAYGLRNPYLFSFDDQPGGNNDLILSDVGQNLFEEVDIIVSGGNYGWPIREGLHCFDPFNPNTVPAGPCPLAGAIDPLTEYPHAVGSTPVGIAVVGGFVYRGANLPGLTGLYIFGDFSTSFGVADGHLLYTDLSQPAPTTIQRLKIGPGDTALNQFIKGIGRDSSGELYLLVSSALGPTGTGGQILKITHTPADFNGSGGVSVQDIFDFLGAYFGGLASADFNHSGGVSVQDIFDFLGGYFGGF